MVGAKTVLAIDPGSSKCGLALVNRDENSSISLVWHDIVPTERIAEVALEKYKDKSFSLIIVGNGTRSRNVIDSLREAMPSVGILVVDERDTTMQARERYWELNPRRGFRRIGPATLWVPPVPIDDYAALVLAERVLTTA